MSKQAKTAIFNGRTTLKIALSIIILVLVYLVLLETSPCYSKAYKSSYTHHKVAKGETLYRIAKKYGVSVKAIMKANGIKNPRKMKVGMVLIIPKRQKGYMPPHQKEYLKNHSKSYHYSRRSAKGSVQGFSFPGQVISMVTGVNEGIDMKLAGGIVRAAADGKVIYSTTSMMGYSSVLILQHQGGYETVYAGKSVEWLKAKDMWVLQGEIIGTVKSGFPLHFEIRHRGRPLSALKYLRR
jgi:murein DD-endopeptidase MepM/ murein hydrolase activator NlpD